MLPGAIADLSELPDDAPEHALALPVLLRFRHALGSKPNRTTEEQEFIVSMQSIVEKLREEGRDEGRREGRDEGQLVGVRSALRRVLAARKLTPNRAEEVRIDGCTDLATLERWVDEALTARSVGEALRVGLAPARRRRSTRVF